MTWVEAITSADHGESRFGGALHDRKRRHGLVAVAPVVPPELRTELAVRLREDERVDLKLALFVMQDELETIRE
jgi:hypothetical protein